MRWFRFYHEALEDPKVQKLHPSLFKHWVNLLCLANKGTPRGVIPSVEDAAFALRLRLVEMRQIIDRLEAHGLLERMPSGCYRPHNWIVRQRQSDDVAKRVSAHRARKRMPIASAPDPERIRSGSNGGAIETEKRTNVGENDGTVTLPKRTVDTDTESDTEDDGAHAPSVGESPTPTEQPKPQPKPTSEPKGFAAFWAAYPKKDGKAKALEQWNRMRSPPDTVQAILDGVAAQKQGRKWREGYVMEATRWLRERRWEDEVEAGGPTRASPNGYQDRSERAAAELDSILAIARGTAEREP